MALQFPSDMMKMNPMDRAKVNGGFVTHRANRANQMQQPDPAEGEDGMKPPNLRDAGDSEEMCGGCAHFDEVDGQGSCKKYAGYPVIQSETCDAFEPAGESDAGPEMEPEESEYK